VVIRLVLLEFHGSPKEGKSLLGMFLGKVQAAEVVVRGRVVPMSAYFLIEVAHAVLVLFSREIVSSQHTGAAHEADEQPETEPPQIHAFLSSMPDGGRTAPVCQSRVPLTADAKGWSRPTKSSSLVSLSRPATEISTGETEGVHEFPQVALLFQGCNRRLDYLLTGDSLGLGGNDRLRKIAPRRREPLQAKTGHEHSVYEIRLQVSLLE
jgi:hypothetical protein